MACLFVLYSIKYFFRGEKRIYYCVLSPGSPVGTWCPEQREALGEKTHVQGWGMAVCFGKELPGARNCESCTKISELLAFPRTEAFRAPNSSPRLS